MAMSSSVISVFIPKVFSIIADPARHRVGYCRCPAGFFHIVHPQNGRPVGYSQHAGGNGPGQSLIRAGRIQRLAYEGLSRWPGKHWSAERLELAQPSEQFEVALNRFPETEARVHYDALRVYAHLSGKLQARMKVSVDPREQKFPKRSLPTLLFCVPPPSLVDD